MQMGGSFFICSKVRFYGSVRILSAGGCPPKQKWISRHEPPGSVPYLYVTAFFPHQKAQGDYDGRTLL